MFYFSPAFSRLPIFIWLPWLRTGNKIISLFRSFFFNYSSGRNTRN